MKYCSDQDVVLVLAKVTLMKETLTLSKTACSSEMVV